MDEQAMQPNPSKKLPMIPVGKKEVIYAGAMLLSGWALWNCLCYGGMNLGIVLAGTMCILCSFLYLLSQGHRPGVYSASLLLLGVVTLSGFARTDDGFVKLILTFFVLVSSNLGLCLMAGKNRYEPGSVRSLLDVPSTAFRYGVERLPEAFRGFGDAFRSSGSVGKKSGAFLVGVVVAVPLLAVMIPLLISADAAFDGLMQLLPDFQFHELLNTVLLGSVIACVLYVRGAALHHIEKEAAPMRSRKGIHPITVNTVLSAVCLLYGVYLFSQLAYLSGGFAGILPQEYTMAQYARRGFFEMAMLSGCNLTIIVFCLGLVRKEAKAPLATRLLCLFIGLVTLFLIATASAKMFLYIDGYALSRLRLLTQIIMLFLAVTTVILMLWLFLPKLPYMKAILLSALIIGAATVWADVDTQVARYNVRNYLSGHLSGVDVTYLNNLGDGAVAYLAQLAEEAPDESVAAQAKRYLENKATNYEAADLRGWNYVSHIAGEYFASGN